LKNAITGMPTPYFEPSSLNSLMWTGLVGFGLAEDFDELAAAELEAAAAEELAAAAVLVTVFVAPLPAELHALTTSAVAAANPNTTRLERRRNGLCTQTTVSEARGLP
jgi:hypothetical protein